MIRTFFGIQIFTEIEISIFEKVGHFFTIRIKKWEHSKFAGSSYGLRQLATPAGSSYALLKAVTPARGSYALCLPAN
jgi:hypothetical protein